MQDMKEYSKDKSYLKDKKLSYVNNTGGMKNPFVVNILQLLI